MALRVIGAGVGRTGTTSLKVALERLLGAPTYHMWEVFQHPDHVPAWHAAVRGRGPRWTDLYAGYRATVDWPGAAFWSELADAFPDAVVLLSTRADADAWFRSVDATINEVLRQGPPSDPGLRAWYAMAEELLASRFSAVPFAEGDAVAAYERHNAAVRAGLPAARLLEWQPGDGWEPLCARLGLTVPDEPFPHLNTTDDYVAVLARGASPRSGDGRRWRGRWPWRRH